MDLVSYIEGKFEKPEIYYHVTNTSNLRSILKQGLIANPKKKTYEYGDQATYGGIYFSKSLPYALNVGGLDDKTNKLIIITQLTKKSLVHDEDYIIQNLADFSLKLYDKYDFSTSGEFGVYCYWAKNYGDEEDKQHYYNIKNDFFDLFIKVFDYKKFQNKQLIYDLFDNYFISNSFKIDIENVLQNITNDKEIYQKIFKEIMLNKEKFKQKTKEIIDKFTILLKNLKKDENSYRILIDKNITYSGNNKIIGIIEINMNKEKITKIIIHYGNKDIIKYINSYFNLSKLTEKIENNKIVFV